MMRKLEYTMPIDMHYYISFLIIPYHHIIDSPPSLPHLYLPQTL